MELTSRVHVASQRACLRIEGALGTLIGSSRIAPPLRRRVRYLRKALKSGRTWLTRQTATSLMPSDALSRNGFVVLRGLLSPSDCAALARRLRAQHKIPAQGKFTSIDAVSRSELVRELLFDRRVIEAARAAIGLAPRFLQVSDLHVGHDHTGWHRDSVHNELGGLDWDEREDSYAVIKLLIYLESEGAALAVLPGSHRKYDACDAEIIAKRAKPRREYVLDATWQNTFLGEADSSSHVICVRPGDAIIIDERIVHRGRRVQDGVVTRSQRGRKMTISFVFGPDSAHSRRLFSTFRYVRRDVPYKDMPAALWQRLEGAGLALAGDYANHFTSAPEELAGVWLRHPEERSSLMARFRAEQVHPPAEGSAGTKKEPPRYSREGPG